MQDPPRDRLVKDSRQVGQSLRLATMSATMACAAVLLTGALFLFRHDEPDTLMLCAALMALGLIALLHARFLHLSRTRALSASQSLAIRAQEFRSVFDAALDALLVLDDQMVCRDANPSALALFRVGREQLVGHSISVFETDRSDLSRNWKCMVAGGQNRGELKLLRADGALIAAEFTASANVGPGQHLLALRDATRRLESDEARIQNLRRAKSAFREARALRTAAFALTQSLPLNPVLDALLETLRSLIPYQTAQVLLLETATQLFLAREVSGGPGKILDCVETVETGDFPTLGRALTQHNGLLIHDTRLEPDWRDLSEGDWVRSWLGVPLRAGDRVMGLLSVMHSRPAHFTAEHLRFAGSMAICTAVAIENARLYERAEICSAELEKRAADLRRAERAHGQA